LWRGRQVVPLSEQRDAANWWEIGKRFSLSRGERAGVRGKGAFDFHEDTHFLETKVAVPL
jgi:hypothetical protein